MLKRFALIGCTALMVCAAPAAMAALIVGGDYDGTDVGGLDSFVAQTNTLSVPGVCSPSGNSSNPAAEKCWADSVTGEDLFFDDSKTEAVQTYNTDTSGVIAFTLNFGAGYYIIKNANWWALIENNASYDWGVVSLDWFADDMNMGQGMTISHVTEFNPTTQVPEPGTLALLGLSLVGFGVARRRMATR